MFLSFPSILIFMHPVICLFSFVLFRSFILGHLFQFSFVLSIMFPSSNYFTHNPFQVCKPDIDYKISWSPCVDSRSDEDYWLDVTFKQPVVPAAVVLYLAADGLTKYSEHQSANTVEVEIFHQGGQGRERYVHVSIY